MGGQHGPRCHAAGSAAWMVLLLACCCQHSAGRPLQIGSSLSAAAAKQVPMQRRRQLQETASSNSTGMCGTLTPTCLETALVFQTLYGAAAPTARLTIPVVVHVIEPQQGTQAWSTRHYQPPTGTMVRETIAQLNQVFAGSVTITGQPESRPAETVFTFRLAGPASNGSSSSPSANSTSGAFLTVTDTDWFNAPLGPAQLQDPASIENVRRAKHHLGVAAVLNVYVRSLRSSGIYGASTFPHYLDTTDAFSTYTPFSAYTVSHDGITIDGATLVEDKDRSAPMTGAFAQNSMTLAHHVAEWLGLFHTYQGVTLNVTASSGTNSSVSLNGTAGNNTNSSSANSGICNLEGNGDIMFTLDREGGPGDGVNTPPHLAPETRTSGCPSPIPEGGPAAPDTCSNFAGFDPQTNLMNAVDHVILGGRVCGIMVTEGQATRMAKAWSKWRAAGVYTAPEVPRDLQANLTALNTSLQLPVYKDVQAPVCGCQLPLLFIQISPPQWGVLSVALHTTTSTSSSNQTVSIVTYTPNKDQKADGQADTFSFQVLDPCAGYSNTGSLHVFFPLDTNNATNATNNATLSSTNCTTNCSNSTVDATVKAVDDSFTLVAGARRDFNVLQNDEFNRTVDNVTIVNVTQPSGAGGSVTIKRLKRIHFLAPGTKGISNFTYTISSANGATSSANVTVRIKRNPAKPNATCPDLKSGPNFLTDHGCLVDTSGTPLGSNVACPAGMHCDTSTNRADVLCAYTLQRLGMVCNRPYQCGPCGGLSVCNGVSPGCPVLDVKAAKGPIAKIVIHKKNPVNGIQAFICSVDNKTEPYSYALTPPDGTGMEDDWVYNAKPAKHTWEWHVRGCDAVGGKSCDTGKPHKQCRVGHADVFRGSTAEHCNTEGAERVVWLSCVYELDNLCYWSCNDKS